METFISTLHQTLYLFLMIVIGFVLAKMKWLPKGADSVLAKMENMLFIPALVMGTFMNDFTVARLSQVGGLFLFSFFLMIFVLPVAIFLPRLLTKDHFTRNIFTYGLAFANFGYMGNSVVQALFPAYFSDYLIFTLPLYILIYVWAVPTLLMSDQKTTLSQKLKNCINPMMIAMLIGIVLGLLKTPFPQFEIPAFLSTSITALGNCMSPVAMILTGITVAQIDLKKTFSNFSIYAITAIRLLIIPLVFVGVFRLLPLPNLFEVCAVCAVSMPLGLNTVVTPSAYGKDTSVAAGMALVSHLLSCITIPIIFMLM